MGIQGLTKVIGDNAPNAIKHHEIKNYFGRKVAIDASMSIYQFLIAVRSEGNQLANADGETTSHLMGIFYRTLRMCDNGIKPLYVFDGKPPTLKSGELAKRLERRKEAQAGLEKAEETGDVENLDKFSRRTVKVTKQHNEDCKRLLRLMGIPYVDAPCEAEAQCSELVKAGKVYAAGSEDMDTITFGAHVLLRHLTFSEARKLPILEIDLAEVLAGLKMDMDQFIDLCILLGCDYCDSIKGIGPHRAVQLIVQHKNLENVLAAIDTTKYPIPDNWPYEEARLLFKKPDVLPAADMDIKWGKPDEDGIVQFLVHENGFAEDRIRNAVKRLTKESGKGVQMRLDNFFAKAAPKTDEESLKLGVKRKADTSRGGSSKKKAGGGGRGKPRK